MIGTRKLDLRFSLIVDYLNPDDAIGSSFIGAFEAMPFGCNSRPSLFHHEHEVDIHVYVSLLESRKICLVMMQKVVKARRLYMFITSFFIQLYPRSGTYAQCSEIEGSR